MTPHPDRPGPISTGIDIVIVAIVLIGFGVILWCAVQAAVLGVRAVAGMVRPRRWPRNQGRRR